MQREPKTWVYKLEFLTRKLIAGLQGPKEANALRRKFLCQPPSETSSATLGSLIQQESQKGLPCAFAQGKT